MPLGRTSRTVDSPMPPHDAFADAQRALALVGTVTSVAVDSCDLRGTIKCGLQTMQVRVHVSGRRDGSQLTLTAQSDDIWAGGAKGALTHLQEAMERCDDPTYTPTRNALTAPQRKAAQWVFWLFWLTLIVGFQFLPWWGIAIFCGLGFAILLILPDPESLVLMNARETGGHARGGMTKAEATLGALKGLPRRRQAVTPPGRSRRRAAGRGGGQAFRPLPSGSCGPVRPRWG
jgi:hypothetical protein